MIQFFAKSPFMSGIILGLVVPSFFLFKTTVEMAAMRIAVKHQTAQVLQLTERVEDEVRTATTMESRWGSCLAVARMAEDQHKVRKKEMEKATGKISQLRKRVKTFQAAVYSLPATTECTAAASQAVGETTTVIDFWGRR